MRTAYSVGVRVFLFVAAGTTALRAQQFCHQTTPVVIPAGADWVLDGAMKELLEDFAPVYSFALGEQYFPVMPFISMER